ncbi:cyclodeaminase/cyclohydrolase family protein [Gordonia rhizosphera]|uniref:Putative hydrolase n=1 Tax=Gordonia rhizosphera NBRC 16068 TaxID=1108045 RepID=K6V9W2_9ACTN|nr:putative hydrolase [Gordonia rhizosphera NBRC 16068]
MTATTALPLRQQSITGFLDTLAAKVPAPGGGASAALHLAQAAALVAMVARYTTGAKYAEHEDLVTVICDRADTARSNALQLAEDDMAAFTGVIESYRLPKGTEAEVRARAEAISAAAARAAGVPADVVDGAAAVLELAERLLPVANRNVISDVAAAADAARAAATTARVNVEINLGSITDGETHTILTARARRVDDLMARADAVTARVRELLTS